MGKYIFSVYFGLAIPYLSTLKIILIISNLFEFVEFLGISGTVVFISRFFFQNPQTLGVTQQAVKGIWNTTLSLVDTVRKRCVFELPYS